MIQDSISLIILFVVIYCLTVWPSWKLLAKLVARSASDQKLEWGFWRDFIVYRLLIAAPYIFLLVLGENILPQVMKSVVIGILVFGVIFFLIRLFFRKSVVQFLWIIYGYTYDGLLFFYPYKHLLVTVAEVVKGQTKQGPILELGSGTGNMIVAMRSCVSSVFITGVDMSPTMTKIARKKLVSDTRVELFQDDVLTYLTKQKSKSFEVIVLQNSLYAINDRDVLWEQLRRVVKDDGSIVVSNSDRSGSSSIIKEHLRSESFVRLLHPKLLLVGIIDMFISQFSQNGIFSFLSEQQVKRETRTLFDMSKTRRVYGDVNILFILTPR